MHPVIYRFPTVHLFGKAFSPTIYSYGLMLTLTFVVGATLTYFELRRKNMPEDVVPPITMIGVIAGIIGAKVFAGLEDWDRFMKQLEHPLRWVLRGSGLSYLGGFVFATVGTYLYLRARKVPFLSFCDAVAPGLMIGYGIARIGCQLAGDGDYGIPSDLPWAMAYPNGTVPTLERVHPTPVYETLASFALFGWLWAIRKKERPPGSLFFMYLIASSISRFLVEFIRRNPKWLLGLSQSQLISLFLISVALFGLYRNRQLAAQARSG